MRFTKCGCVLGVAASSLALADLHRSKSNLHGAMKLLRTTLSAYELSGLLDAQTLCLRQMATIARYVVHSRGTRLCAPANGLTVLHVGWEA